MRNLLKYLIIAILLTVSSVRSNAQIGAGRRILAVGVNGGATASTVSFVPSIKQVSLTGNTAGITLRYTSEKYFWMVCAAQLEVNFAQRGWKELIEDGSGNQYSRRLNYIETPFMAHLGFGRESCGFQGFLNLGPQLGFYLNDKEIYGGTLPWDTSNRANEVTAQYGKPIENRLEYGITGGAGVELKTGAGIFSVEGRYLFGLSDIWHNSKKDDFARSASSTISIRLSYLIEL